MDWDKIFVLACNLKRYRDQVDRHYIINYASTMLGRADHIGLTFISYNPWNTFNRIKATVTS